MRECIIIVTIIIIIITGDVCVNKYLNNSSQKIIGDLENLKKGINDKLYGEKELAQQSEEIYKNWQTISNKWAILVLHSELDQIETSLIKMKTQIKENNLDIGLEELETSIFLINHISKKEKFCLINIF